MDPEPRRPNRPAPAKKALSILLLALLLAGCSQPAAPTAPPLSPAETSLPPTATTEPEAETTRAGSRIMLPYREESAGIALFHPPNWTVELDPASGLLLAAPEAAAGFRDISNALIVATPSSVVGQSIVAGEEALTEERAAAAFQFLQANFAMPFVPDMVLGEEITISSAGGTERASVPFSGTTVQDIPVTGRLTLIVDNQQVAGALTLTTGGEALAELLAEMVGSIALSDPGQGTG